MVVVVVVVVGGVVVVVGLSIIAVDLESVYYQNEMLQPM